MYAHQEIRMNIPTAGSGPRNLASAIRRPSGPRNIPQAPVRFKNFKEAMEYLKEKKQEEDEE